MTNKIKECIDNLKHLPGVYLMHDKNEKVIYVGKAKDLFKRVSQYFLRPQSGKVFKMVTEVDYFETIITSNEKEALVLEMNLIQTYYPKFNILLKDDSHYPYIAIKKGDDPIINIKRNNKDNKYDYFGPYPNSGAAFQMVDLINKIFPIRKCKTLRSSTCLYYHLGQCLAPCVNKIDKSVLSSLREDIITFLKGDNSKQKAELKTKMLKASETQNYELANEYKKILDAIEHITTDQNVEFKDKKDIDIFSYSVRNGYIGLSVLNYRKGILLGRKVYTVEEFGDNEEQVSDLILQYYENVNVPKEIVINNKNIIETLSHYLDAIIIEVSKGRLYDLVLMSKENADNALDQYFLSPKLDDSKIELLEYVGQLLNIPTPYHIDLFDNSHLQGSDPVGAMVSFINGEPNKKLYRKFLIKHEESRDDIASMKEVITRHYSRLKEENKKMPDLILVDGGLNQVKAAVVALALINVEIPVYGLYKNEKHQTDGLIDFDGHQYTLNNKSLFFLLTRMQDEVHRFAISFHREKRNKSMSNSILDNIKGLGEKRKEVLYRAYPDITMLKNASIDELRQLLPLDIANEIYIKLGGTNK